MKRYLLMVLTSVAVFASRAPAFLPELEPTKVEADLACESDDFMVFAIKMPRANEKAKIWLTSSDQKEIGFSLEVLDFKVARCPGCFSFKARFVDSILEGNAVTFNLTVIDDGEIRQLACKSAN